MLRCCLLDQGNPLPIRLVWEFFQASTKSENFLSGLLQARSSTGQWSYYLQIIDDILFELKKNAV